MAKALNQVHPGAGTALDKEELLESWTAIAAYLGRNIRTCQMWEHELGLPVHRMDNSPKARVFAYKHELERWFEARLNEGKNLGEKFGGSQIPREFTVQFTPRKFFVIVGIGLIAAIAFLVGRCP